MQMNEKNSRSFHTSYRFGTYTVIGEINHFSSWLMKSLTTELNPRYATGYRLPMLTGI